MAYRNFTCPGFASQGHTVAHWMEWMEEQADILIPVAPHHERSCLLCHGSSGYLDGGTDTWARCLHCHRYGDVIDRFIPITYSIDAGLESMLHRYKDRGVAWLRYPLSSLLHTFVQDHADCIDDEAGGVDVATIVPSDNQDRTFSHLDFLLRGAISGDPAFARFEWDLEFLTRDRTTTRPARGALKPSAYEVAPFVVKGSSVLVLDDTWTSGSSTASVAAALKEAGALEVTVLTLGRQMKADGDWGSTQAICVDRRGEVWRHDECVLCA